MTAELNVSYSNKLLEVAPVFNSSKGCLSRSWDQGKMIRGCSRMLDSFAHAPEIERHRHMHSNYSDNQASELELTGVALQLQGALGPQFRVVREVPAGMSRVFVVADSSLRRNVIVKVLTPAMAEGVSAERFSREAMTLAQLQHPHIVPILSAGRAGDLPFYMMPYVSGESARVVLEKRQVLPIREVVGILRDVAKALDFAHQHGIVHRDIKPDNILVSGNAAVVSDFGIAKAVSEARAASATGTLTSVGTSIGTPAYMAPEQALADPGVDHRADIYSFGATAYELLTGASPFAGLPATAMLKAHVTEMPADVASKRADVPPALARLVMRCLEKDPDRRPSSAAEVLAALDDVTGEATAVPPRPRRWMIAAAVVVAAAVLVAAALRRESGDARTHAVAVLPFENLSRDTASEYFSDGMTEQLVGDLGRASGLRVASRAASFAYKGRRVDPREAAAALHVDAIVTGSVRRDGNRIRLDAELVNADGTRRWSQQFDRTLDDIFATQEEIARAITSALKVSFAAQRSPASATDGTTFDLFLRARHQSRAARNRQQLDSAIAMLRAAIARDSTYAPAWGVLAQSYRRMAEYTMPRAVLPLAKDAAMRAVRLDPSDLEAGLALANMIFNVDWNWAAAEREYLRVLELHPNSSAAHYAYAQFLQASRRFEEVLVHVDRQHEIEWQRATDTVGLRANQLADRVWASIGPGVGPELDSLLELAIRDQPTLWRPRWVRAMALLHEKPAVAVAELEQVRAILGDRLPQLSHLGMSYGLAGQLDSARSIIAEVERRSRIEYVPKDQLAVLYLAIGDKRTAFRWLRQAIDEHHYWLPYLNGHPMLEPYRNDPEYRALMKRIGVPDSAL